MISDSIDIGKKCVVFNPRQEKVVIGAILGVTAQDYDYPEILIQPTGEKEDCFSISSKYVVSSFHFRQFLLKTEILVNPLKGKRGIILDVPCISREEHPDKYKVQFYEGRKEREAWFDEGEIKKYEEEYFEDVSLDDEQFKCLCEEELKRYRQQPMDDRYDGLPSCCVSEEGFVAPPEIEELLYCTLFEKALSQYLAR